MPDTKQDLVWSKSPPRKVGWYWSREFYEFPDHHWGEPRMTRVSEKRPSSEEREVVLGDPMYLVASDDSNCMNFSQHEWAGPIPEPSEPSDV